MKNHIYKSIRCKDALLVTHAINALVMIVSLSSTVWRIVYSAPSALDAQHRHRGAEHFVNCCLLTAILV